MSNWRDRTERDALIRHHVQHHYENNNFSSSKNDLRKKNINIFVKILFASGSIFLSIILFYISISSIISNNNSTVSISINKPNLKISRAICEIDPSGEFFMLVADSSGGVKQMLKFNPTYFPSSGYTPARRCSLVAAKVNAAIESGKEGYITTNLTGGRGVLCLTEDSQDKCVKQNSLTTISSSDKKNENSTDSDYIMLELCTIYSKSSRFEKSEDSNICTFPLTKSLKVRLY